MQDGYRPRQEVGDPDYEVPELRAEETAGTIPRCMPHFAGNMLQVHDVTPDILLEAMLTSTIETHHSQRRHALLGAERLV